MTPTYKRLSTSCQQLIHQTPPNFPSPSILIRSCLADPDLLPAIINHKCNNVILTPSGLYFDMAITVAKYLLEENPSSLNIKDQHLLLPKGINVRDMQVHKPLIVQDVSRISECWIEMETTISFSPTTLTPESQEEEGKGEEASTTTKTPTLTCTFHTITPTGTRLQTTGHCTINFESPTLWHSTWSSPHITPTIQSLIDTLLTRAHKETTGQIRLVQSAQAYEIFQTFVQYTGPYQTMSETIFSLEEGEGNLEATSLLNFTGLIKNFPKEEVRGPFLWDASCHISGFVCNAVEKDRLKNAFISYGVGSMKISDKFTPWREGVTVRNYVRMEKVVGDETVLEGNVYILQDGVIVGVWERVRFKRIPRRVLNVFLPPGKKG